MDGRLHPPIPPHPQKWKLMAYISKLLNKVKRNYEIHDKKILAIIKCLETWRHFLEGAKSQF